MEYKEEIIVPGTTIKVPFTYTLLSDMDSKTYFNHLLAVENVRKVLLILADLYLQVEFENDDHKHIVGLAYRDYTADLECLDCPFTPITRLLRNYPELRFWKESFQEVKAI